MWRKKRPAAFDNFPAVRFERVGDVVQIDTRDHSYVELGQTVDDKLEKGIIDGAAAFDEAASKGRNRIPY